MERTSRQRSPARDIARALLLSTALGAASGVAQNQMPAYPEGSVPGMAPNPAFGAPGSMTPGDPGPGVGSGVPGTPGTTGTPGYPGYRPPTAQPARPDAPRTSAPPASGAGAPRSGPGAYESRGSGDGRLPPSVYSRGEERKSDPNRLPSSPSGGVGVGGGVGR
jgi:hypothetical protein